MLPAVKTTADVLIVQFEADKFNDYLKIAASLRAGGIRTEVYPEQKKMDKQFKYADRRGIRFVVIAGMDELQAGKVKVKCLADGSQTEFPYSADSTAELVEALQKLVVGQPN